MAAIGACARRSARVPRLFGERNDLAAFYTREPDLLPPPAGLPLHCRDRVIAPNVKKVITPSVWPGTAESQRTAGCSAHTS